MAQETLLPAAVRPWIQSLKAVCYAPGEAWSPFRSKLNGQGVEGNDATLSYATQKPRVNLQITAHLKKNDKELQIVSQRDARYQDRGGSAKEMVSAFTTQLPGETSMLSLAMVLLVIAGVTSTVKLNLAYYPT
ncbi:MAG: hypothetical protein IPP97_28420 [Candidatus Obscuribacter sp.]|nr:hypothetical protein [Candidatus Obscuribacter sp.]